MKKGLAGDNVGLSKQPAPGGPEHVVRRIGPVTPEAPREVVGYLRSLPALWADAGPDGRQAMATTLFARTEVLGFEQMIYELTPDAIELGLDAALPAVFELSCAIAEFGRGERRPTTLRHLNVPASLPLEIEVTGVERWLTSSTA